MREDEEECKSEIGGDPGGDDEDAVGHGPVPEEIGVVGGDGAMGIIGVGEGNEAAEGESAEGVLDAGGAGGGDEAGEDGAEADGELADADALEGGGEEVAGFVHDDDGGEDGGGLEDGLEGVERERGAGRRGQAEGRRAAAEGEEEAREGGGGEVRQHGG